MEDIAPKLAEEVMTDFRSAVARDLSLVRLRKRAADGLITYAEVGTYAQKVGEHASRAFRSHIFSEDLPNGRMYYNIAERVIRPVLEEVEYLVAMVAREAQKAVNSSLGVNLAVVDPDDLKEVLNGHR